MENKNNVVFEGKDYVEPRLDKNGIPYYVKNGYVVRDANDVIKANTDGEPIDPYITRVYETLDRLNEQLRQQDAERAARLQSIKEEVGPEPMA